MKEKIRILLLSTEVATLTTPNKFAEWILWLRKQENLFFKNQTESPEEYEQSGKYINELFWQIACLRYAQLLNISTVSEKINSIENLFRTYDKLSDIDILLPFNVNTKELMYRAWDVAKELDCIVNDSVNFIDDTADTQNFFYLLRHYTGHDVRPQVRRFASNLSRDLKESKEA